MSKKPKTPVDFYFPIKKPPLFCRNDVPTNLNNATVMSMMLKNCFYGVADLQSGRSCIFRRDHHCRGSSLTLHSSYFYMKLFFSKWCQAITIGVYHMINTNWIKVWLFSRLFQSLIAWGIRGQCPFWEMKCLFLY